METLIKLRLSWLLTKAQHDTQALRGCGNRTLVWWPGFRKAQRPPGFRATRRPTSRPRTPRECPPLLLRVLSLQVQCQGPVRGPLQGFGVAGSPRSPLCSLHTAGHQPWALKPKRCGDFTQHAFIALGFFSFLLFFYNCRKTHAA